jgi:hypothetical protein
MTISTVSKEIDGHVYQITQLGARDARKMLVRITKLLGPSAGRLTSGYFSGGLDQIASAVFELSNSVSDEDFDYFCETFGQCTKVDMGSTNPSPLLQGVKPLTTQTQDIWFGGSIDTLLKWIAACLEVNFRPLWSMWKSAADRVQEGQEVADQVKKVRKKSVTR